MAEVLTSVESWSTCFAYRSGNRNFRLARAEFPLRVQRMPSPSESSLPPPPAAAGGNAFALTQWSMVLTAGQRTASSAEALEKLCRAYWAPLHAHVLRLGYARHEAEDLTQEFFARILADDSLASVRPEKGRFRSWLLGALRHFLLNEWKRTSAQKRGGGREVFSLDAMEPALRAACEPRDDETPELAYDRRWAEILLARVNARTRREFEAAGQTERFEALKRYLLQGYDPVSYADTAQRLGLSESAVKSAIYKLRQRYGVILRDEIAQTVTTPEEVEDEIRCLLSALKPSGG